MGTGETVLGTVGAASRVPTFRASLELFKPITWFPPMWAFACGAVSSGVPLGSRPMALVVGIVLAGPLLCGASQACNDWFDRHVDAVNEPHRVIPSGRMPGRWGLGLAVAMSVLALVVAASLGPWVFAPAALGLFLGWAYSAPPLRLKREGWTGAATCALAYEGLPWIAAAAAATGAAPSAPIVTVALLYAAGATGIMAMNDFKSMEGDRLHGVRSIPARLGMRRGAIIACAIMLAAQLGVLLALVVLDAPFHAAVVGALVLAQLVCMRRLVADPLERAPWFNAVGTGLYVIGMMVSAHALGGLS